MKTSEVLNMAADEIERRGWWQGSGGGVAHGQCASNAIAEITNLERDGLVLPPQKAFWEFIGGTDVQDIWHWNDAPERTATEVVEALRAAAVIEAAKESADVREPVTV